jgi:predicted PurR-regulated permease PerM
MNQRGGSDGQPDGPFPGHLLDVLIRGGLLLGLAVLCYRVLAPFLVLLVWALILAVALHPLQQALAHRIGGRNGLAATLVTALAVLLIVVPTAVLLSSMGDTVHRLVAGVQDHTLQVPPPRPALATWPVVGEKVYAVWENAHTDLPGLLRSLQPKLGELTAAALAMVASIGGAILQFIAALVVAGVMMAYGESGARSAQAVFARLAGAEQGERFNHLAVSTIRAVAQGVVGVALIQAILVGVCLLIAGVPWAGVLAAIVLVLAIAQLPAALVTLPVIAYVWTSGHYGTGPAIAYTVLLFVAGLADNVLKPLLLGRGVDAPMPVILLGALGGMASAGLHGMFVGAVVLALGYQVLTGWVATEPIRPGR